ncbi:hypothetical protein K457DRAFT_389894 [Linnemannia elongata AG-77]|uniref:Uncharacterized protein n=1 Tax=Linnemannia elongata AG-77 TaxID=1314771 RepID=A0A197K190_9FUNG|nr:hypothetical protein K457DRAFT_389894 [Linnemannia elongata AG-77]
MVYSRAGLNVTKSYTVSSYFSLNHCCHAHGMTACLASSPSCLPLLLFFGALTATCPSVCVCLLLQAKLANSFCSSWLFLVVSMTNRKEKPGLHATRLLRLL